MDERARIPVTLPVPNPTKSYWQSPLSPLATHATPGPFPTETDTLIIGSGITGAAIAHFLLASSSPSAAAATEKITMLEARTATSGATGRNGGHTKAASYHTFPAHAAALGTEAACRIARLELANIRAVHAFAAAHLPPPHAESRPCQTVDAIYDPGRWESAKRAVEAMRSAMPGGDDASRYELYDAEETARRFRVSREGLCGGVAYEAGSISAYGFATGVLELCVAKGMRLYTETPALSLEKRKKAGGNDEDTHMNHHHHHHHPWVVETPRGKIAAKRVVLATNAYTAFLHPKFQEAIVPLRGQVTAHRPGSNMPVDGLATTYSMVYESGFDYMITRPPAAAGTGFAGDIVIGGGLSQAPDAGLCEYGVTDDSGLNPAISSYLYGTTPRYFGSNWGDDDDDDDHPEGRVRAEWSGIMGYSPDGLPFVGQVPDEDGLWVCAGFQGHGMVMCWMCAKALAVMMKMMMMMGEGEGDDEKKQEQEEDDLRNWFPDAFRVTSERLAKRF